jgi:hypothetical protein
MRGNSGQARLANAGVTLNPQGDRVVVQQVQFGSEAAKYGLAAGDEITAVLVPVNRPSRYWLAIPAVLLLGVIYVFQRRRKRHGR